MDLNIINIFETVIAAIVIGIFGFFGWVWKRSIYGEIERVRKDITDIKSNCILEKECSTMREGCSGVLNEKITRVMELLHSIADRQILLISRFDHHMNGNSLREKGE